jgi:hypothetical protein
MSAFRFPPTIFDHLPNQKVKMMMGIMAMLPMVLEVSLENPASTNL